MKIKACHITSVHNRYDIRIFEKECKTLAQNGYDVTLIVNDEKNDELINNIRVLSINNLALNRWDRIFSQKTKKKLLAKAIEVDADIYHFHDPELIPVGIKLLGKGKKVIYDSHEDVPRQILVKEWIPCVFRKPISLMYEIYENIAVKRFTAVVVPTPHIVERFSKLSKNVSMICNFPALNEFSATAKRSQGKGASGCYIGDISAIRGIRQIAEATERARIGLNLCGKFQSKALEEEILSSYKHIKYWGVLDRIGVVSVLNQSAFGFVTLLASPNDANSYPIKMFEYMAAGVPVIASDFEVYRSIIRDNECGICVDPYDVEKIFQTITFMMENPEAAQIMGDRGRLAIDRKYNWAMQETELLRLYNTLCSNTKNYTLGGRKEMTR